MIVTKHIWSMALVLTFGMAVYGCTSLPETSRTASVHDIKVEEKLSPDNIVIQPGDEVRWVNLRKLPVQVDVPDLQLEDLSCQRGFTNPMGSLRESAQLNPNETVALCFKKAAVVNYNVRAETSLGGGKQVMSGVVRVGNPQ